MDEINWMTATELVEAQQRGELSATEIAEATIDRMRVAEPATNAFIEWDANRIRASAADVDRRRAAGLPLGPLAGVPYAVKDQTPVAGLPSTGALPPNRDVRADRDVALVRRLKAADAVLVGKTTMPEAGYYGGTESHLYGATHNPWKRGHSVGGSSGGSAAAVAAGIVPLAEGSDGAGSVRIPAALCGVVGTKPSLGRIPLSILAGRYNTWAFHGTLSRSVADAALMLDVMSGPDPEDPLSIPADGSSLAAAVPGASVRGWRIAWSPDLGLGSGYVDTAVLAVAERAAQAFTELGADVVAATPAWDHLEDTMWQGIWIPAYAALYDTQDWPALRGRVDDRLIDLIESAPGLSALDVARAEVRRAEIWDRFAAFMSDFDVLLSPTLATTALPHGQFAPSAAGCSVSCWAGC